MPANRDIANPVTGARRWTITDYNYPADKDTYEWRDTWPGGVRYAVWQKEKCPTTGTIHIQAYLEFDRAVRFQHMTKVMGKKMKCFISGGTAEENQIYCTKADSRVEGPFEWGKPVSQGQRTDIESFTERILNGESVFDIATGDSGNAAVYVKFHRGMEKLEEMMTRKLAWRFRNVTVNVVWGECGTGKTRTIFENCPDLYIHDNIQEGSIWFDGYNRQKVILFDDFYGEIRISKMLRLLDGYPVRLPYKGGFTWAMYDTVFITSNVHPDEWYQSENIPEGVRDALKRRIKHIWHVQVFQEYLRDQMAQQLQGPTN